MESQDLATQTKKNIQCLLTSTPNMCSIRNLKYDYLNTIGEEIPYERFGYQTLEQYLRSIPDAVEVRGHGFNATLVPVVSQKSAHINEMVCLQKNPRKGPKRSIPPRFQGRRPNRFSNNLNTSTSSNFRQPTLNNHVHVNAELSKKEPPRPLSSIDTSEIARQFNQANSVEKHPSNVPDQVRANLRDLISRFDDGIWCIDVPVEYRKLYGSNLNYSQYGYRSLITMCSALSDIFRFVRPDTGDFKLYNAEKPLPESVEVPENSQNNSTNTNVRGDLDNVGINEYNLILPKDIFLLDEIKHEFISENIKENDVVDVVVAEIYDPSKFYVYLNDSPLNTLMDDMQTFYDKNNRDYLIPEGVLREGLYCTQIFLNEYHRALIVDTLVHEPHQVRVAFIDFGTVAKVPTKGLCFLMNRFAKLPAQAIRCRLANIKPVEEGLWLFDATERFKKLVTKRNISAKLSVINRQDEFVEVYLADITDSQIVYINDVLVEENLAINIDKEQTPPPFKSIFKPITQNIHLFPTFLELEYGLVPTVDEMKKLVDNGVPINFCLPQYFTYDDPSIHQREQEIIESIEAQQEHLIALSAIPIPHDYNVDVLREEREMDFSIFGELEDEMRKFHENEVNHIEESVEITAEQEENEEKEEHMTHMLCNLDLNITDDEDEEEVEVVFPVKSTNPFHNCNFEEISYTNSTNPFLDFLDEQTEEMYNREEVQNFSDDSDDSEISVSSPTYKQLQSDEEITSTLNLVSHDLENETKELIEKEADDSEKVVSIEISVPNCIQTVLDSEEKITSTSPPPHLENKTDEKVDEKENKNISSDSKKTEIKIPSIQKLLDDALKLRANLEERKNHQEPLKENEKFDSSVPSSSKTLPTDEKIKSSNSPSFIPAKDDNNEDEKFDLSGPSSSKTLPTDEKIESSDSPSFIPAKDDNNEDDLESKSMSLVSSSSSTEILETDRAKVEEKRVEPPRNMNRTPAPPPGFSYPGQNRPLFNTYHQWSDGYGTYVQQVHTYYMPPCGNHQMPPRYTGPPLMQRPIHYPPSHPPRFPNANQPVWSQNYNNTQFPHPPQSYDFYTNYNNPQVRPQNFDFYSNYNNNLYRS